MGNCKCDIRKVCTDSESEDNNNINTISHATITISDFHHWEESKLISDLAYIDPYNSYINFYNWMSKLTFLQRQIRKYIAKNHRNQKKIKFDLVKKIPKLKGKFKVYPKENPNSKSISDQFFKKKNYTSKPTNHKCTQIININILNSIKDDIINDENQTFTHMYSQDFDFNRMTNSLISNSLSIRCDNKDETISSIKGYFLKKSKNFKFQGFQNNNKKKQGFGIITWDDSSKLVANFDNCKAQGYGKYYNHTGSIFSGYYINNRPKGFGIYNLVSKVRYEGEWVNNNLEGIGLEAWEDETYYQGEYNNGWKHGVGWYRWVDGMIYQGDWINNEMCGLGLIWYPDERLFQGEIKNGVMNGFGEFLWPDGKRYIGNYKEDKKEGFGIFFWSEQPLIAFSGFWRNGKMHGFGLKINSNMCIKYGIWREGRMEKKWSNKWDIWKYVKKEQSKYLKFFEMSDQMIVNSIVKMVMK